MDFPASPLVLTKLRVPAARARSIPRAHLIDLLTPTAGVGLILVSAPAGYGKTTLLAEWARSLMNNGSAVAWYALDPEDDDPIPFRAYFIASLIQALGQIPELIRIAQLLRAAPEMDLQRILPAVINAVISCNRECVLILDDYHLIGAPAIHSALAYLLDHLPENLRIAIGSRADPPLPLARLRGRGQLLEIRTAGLRFSVDETARFLNEVMQLEISPEGARALEERTEGWVTGLQLAALSLSGRADKEQVSAAFTGSHRYLAEYLMDEVVDSQPEGVQSFLLATSILERMCGELGNALGDEYVAGVEILNQLELTNLFVIPLDDQGDWYRYHHLFRDFLQSRLNKTWPERIPLLHRAACEWLLGEKLLREAARHAFQAQDWEYAAAFVEQHSFTLIAHGDISTIYEWCSAFPEEVMQRHPMICLLQSLALAYSFRRQNRDRVEARLQQVDRLILTMEDRQFARGLIDMAGVVHTFMAFAPDPAADPRELLALAQGILSAYPEGDAGQFSGLLLTGYAYAALHDAHAAEEAFEAARQIALRERLYFGIVEATFHLARLAHSQGLLQRAMEICRQGQADIASVLDHPEQTLPALGSLDIALGCVLLEQDRLGEAEDHLRRGLDLMGGGMNPYYLMTAYTALFRLHEIMGEMEEALKYLERLEMIWPDITFYTRGLLSLHRLRISPKDPATRAEATLWRQEFLATVGKHKRTPGMGPCGAAEVFYRAHLAWAEIQIILDNPQPALAYIQRQIDQATASGLKQRVLELTVLQALGWRANGDASQSRAALENALAIALPEGYIHTFDQGPALGQLLGEAAQQGVYREYAERIMNAIKSRRTRQRQAETGDRPARLPFGESLSERELEVLRLIAQGATNYEIAEQLVITVGTVKSHINHVLGKLDAHNRTEAVARARGLGWLEI